MWVIYLFEWHFDANDIDVKSELLCSLDGSCDGGYVYGGDEKGGLGSSHGEELGHVRHWNDVAHGHVWEEEDVELV